MIEYGMINTSWYHVAENGYLKLAERNDTEPHHDGVSVEHKHMRSKTI